MRRRRQAVFQTWAIEHFLQVVEPLVPQTLLPVLRFVSANPTRVDRAYAELMEERACADWPERAAERSQLRLSAFVRELEWACRELEHFMSPGQYEALVTGSAARLLERKVSPWLPGVLRFVSGEARPGTGAGVSRLLETALARSAGRTLMRVLRPLSPLLGEVKLREWSTATGEARLWIPRCHLRTAGGSAQAANRVCKHACKGAIESVFGRDASLHVEMRPRRHGSCEIGVEWDAPGAVRPTHSNPTTRQRGDFVPEAALLRRRAAEPAQMWN